LVASPKGSNLNLSLDKRQSWSSYSKDQTPVLSSKLLDDF